MAAAPVYHFEDFLNHAVNDSHTAQISYSRIRLSPDIGRRANIGAALFHRDPTNTHMRITVSTKGNKAEAGYPIRFKFHILSERRLIRAIYLPNCNLISQQIHDRALQF